jgi:tRNA/rRNA methyltransferase
LDDGLTGRPVPRFRIVLVEPKSEGNVGAVARSMKNFGQTEMVLVNPPALGDECRGRALHAWDVVSSAKVVKSLSAALEGCDFVVGTTARVPDADKSYLRNPIDAREFPERIKSVEGTIALLFGREDFGLLNAELEFCDLLLTIPSSPLYRSLNLAHAVTVVLYELYVQTVTQPERVSAPMSGVMRSHFQTNMDRLIAAMNLPEHQERNVKTAYRKLFGRAVPSAWEYYVLMGILKRCLQKFGLHTPTDPRLPDFDLEGLVDEDALKLLEPGALD